MIECLSSFSFISLNGNLCCWRIARVANTTYLNRRRLNLLNSAQQEQEAQEAHRRALRVGSAGRIPGPFTRGTTFDAKPVPKIS